LGSDRSAQRAAGHPPAQRKTTLKWDENGELTALDMARIVDRLTQPELQRCDLDPS
jgi:hypothetical protein